MSRGVNIKAIRSTADTARKYKWDVSIGAGNNNFLGSSVDYLNVRCMSADQPKGSTQVIDVDLRGWSRKEAGMFAWDPITLTFIETDVYALTKLFYKWSNQQANHVYGHQFRKAQTEGSGIWLSMESIDDEFQTKWVLVGCVMENMELPTLDNSKDGIWDDFTVTVHYDYAFMGDAPIRHAAEFEVGNFGIGEEPFAVPPQFTDQRGRG